MCKIRLQFGIELDFLSTLAINIYIYRERERESEREREIRCDTCYKIELQLKFNL